MKKLIIAILALSFMQGCTGTGAVPTENPENGEGCPMGFDGGHTKDQLSLVKKNSDWWPNKLNLNVLRQNSELVNP